MSFVGKRPAPEPAAGPVCTTCPYCGVGCGVLARCGDASAGSIAIAGDPTHPSNAGRLCSKGSALGETLGLEGRLLHATVDGRRARLESALDLVARRFRDTIAAHGPDSIAFYVSGQLLTEDYYVANKLMKGFIGSANIDTNSRLCMASSVAGHRRAFGADVVPGTYEDLEAADLVVLVGSNLAWCHPVLFQRLAAARETRGTRIVVIDPRATATTEIADLHLALAPGSDVALFNGLLAALVDGGHVDRRYVWRHTRGLGAAVAAARQMSRRYVARTTGIGEAALAAFYDLFAATERVVTIYSQGVNQSSAGTDKVNAIINCHLATGRIGRPGMGPFSVTGQPNAMGGREVGGLANMLAAHMEIADPGHRDLVQRFWASPTMAARPGFKAVDLFRAVGDGRVKALWIMATNPVDSMPEADGVRDALRRCPFVVVSDIYARTDTTELAHVLLPAAGWGEKDGTVTSSERRISRQRPFLPPPGDAKPDWWLVAEVAKRMGWRAAFSYAGPAQIFAEHARLSGFANDGGRAFDIGAWGGVTDAAYDAMQPFQWPAREGAPAVTTRFFADGGFFTPDGRGRFIATPYREPAARVDDQHPMLLNTGRIRDQWHTMTRTARSARLMGHIAEPFLEIHPEDARSLGLADAALATVSSPHGQAILRVLVTPRQRRGSVFAPMHWTAQLSSRGRIDAVVDAAVDPVSGQPELKLTAVAVRPFAARWHAFGLLSQKPEPIGAAYWAMAPAKSGWRVEIADVEPPADWAAFAATLLGAASPADLMAYADRRRGQHRFALFDGDRLLGAVFVSPDPVAVSRSWATDRLANPIDSIGERLGLLAGHASEASADRGAIVCACFGVGVRQIEACIAGGATSVEAVGRALEAGTNCGSCRAEIGRLVRSAPAVPKAGPATHSAGPASQSVITASAE